MLYMLGQAELSRTLMPVGIMTKQQARSRARRLGLRNADKRDSQDVCFVSQADRGRFIAGRVGSVPGRIVDTSGAMLGEHRGVHGFTIGQRRGLGVAVGERRYVVDVDAETATVTVGDPGALLRDEVCMTDVRFVAERPVDGARVLSQMSAHGVAVPGHLEGDVVRFDTPQRRVAPGQVVALYDGDRVIGGGAAA